MKKRPIVVSLAALVLIVTGAAGLGLQLYHLRSISALHSEDGWIALVRLLAIVAGAFLLRGCNWARWLAVAWMAFHVILSFWHPLRELMVHVILMALLVWALFRGKADAYFARREAAR
jgi:hypothetical protein